MLAIRCRIALLWKLQLWFLSLHFSPYISIITFLLIHFSHYISLSTFLLIHFSHIFLITFLSLHFYYYVSPITFLSITFLSFHFYHSISLISFLSLHFYPLDGATRPRPRRWVRSLGSRVRHGGHQRGGLVFDWWQQDQQVRKSFIFN